MNTFETIAGVAVVCDLQGTILQVLRDDLGLTNRLVTGQSITLAVNSGSVEKVLRFLHELRQRKAAFNWEVNVPVSGQLMTLHLVGGVFYDRLLILAAPSDDGLARSYEEFVMINSEQTNALRTAVKEQTLQARPPIASDGHMFDELTRLNNELVTAQRDLAKKNVELGRTNEQKDRLLGMASHDVRTSLAVIKTYSEFLMEDLSGVLHEEQKDQLATIRSSAEFLLKMVTDLLDISKIEQKGLEFNLQPVDLVSLVDHNVALNRVLAERKRIGLVLSADIDRASLMMDAVKIEQVLNNLIGNAVKFSYPDSTVEIRLAGQDDEIVISVRDQGQGIPAHEMNKLFKPFEKISVKSTAGEKSTGLGLAICRKIVEGHQGRIWVKSEVGKGSTFSFSLPMPQSAVESQTQINDQAPVDLPPAPPPALRVLVVDDNIVNQRIAQRMLERLGHSVDTANCGTETLEMLERQSYDVILMDIQMPEMDGIETSRRICQRWSQSQRPWIIATTASLVEQDQDACRSAGMDDFLEKPLHTENLQMVLERYQAHADRTPLATSSPGKGRL